MLRERLLTAAVLIPGVTAGILWLPTVALSGILAVLVLFAGYELARLSGIHQPGLQFGYVLLLALAMGLLYLKLTATWWLMVQMVATLWWVFISVRLLSGHQAIQKNRQYRLGLLVLGSGLLLVAWASLLRLHTLENPYLMLFLMVLIWSADAAAYFVGRAWGKRRLAPRVSPGKTWAGVGGATLAAIICALVLWQFAWLPSAWPILVLLCVSVAWLSIGGDLWESLLKRQAGVKDSGRLLPGHGGVLDRIDSLLAAAPAFAVGLEWLA